MSDQHEYINSGVYVLELQGGNYYVGASKNIDDRVENHTASWTQEHDIKRVVDRFPAKAGLKELEKEVTLMYMERYGWRSVRGAGWTRTNMEHPPRPLQQKAAD